MGDRSKEFDGHVLEAVKALDARKRAASWTKVRQEIMGHKNHGPSTSQVLASLRRLAAAGEVEEILSPPRQMRCFFVLVEKGGAP